MAGSIRQDSTGRGADAAIIFAEPSIEAEAASRAAVRRGAGALNSPAGVFVLDCRGRMSSDLRAERP